MSLAAYEGSDLGEILVAAPTIKPGDFESYYNVWSNLANRVDKTARSIDSKKHRVSARNAFFKAATYYRSADFFLHGNWEDPRINAIWKSHRAAFDAAIALLPVPGKRITLRARDNTFTIPAIFYGTGLPGRRPTLILGNGYDGAQEEMFHVIGQAALQRGINVITYEGPGQPTVRREQHIGFIYDWEKVVSPIVDWAWSRPEIDPLAIGLLGYSFGGYLAPRAAAFDRRIAAVLAVNGLIDFGKSLLDNFPPQLVGLYRSGNKEAFNGAINGGLADPSTPTAIRWGLEQGEWSFNQNNPYDFVTSALDFNLTDVTDRIRQPVFVGDADQEKFFPGQAKGLAEKLGSRATYRLFTSEEGAGEHCQVGGSVFANQVMLDWFEDVIRK